MFEVCRVYFLSTHGKSVVRRVPLDCRVLNPRHTAKVLFAVCPTLDTRQIFWRTAYVLFPVVNYAAVPVDLNGWLDFDVSTNETDQS